MGNSSSGSGTYLLSAGPLTVYGSEDVGASGAATFDESAGVNTVGTPSNTSQLIIGELVGGTGGVYNLGGTGSLVLNGAETIGENGPGTFDQSGGIQTVGPAGSGAYMAIGASDTMGNYNLSGNGLVTVYGPE